MSCQRQFTVMERKTFQNSKVGASFRKRERNLTLKSSSLLKSLSIMEKLLPLQDRVHSNCLRNRSHSRIESSWTWKRRAQTQLRQDQIEAKKHNKHNPEWVPRNLSSAGKKHPTNSELRRKAVRLGWIVAIQSTAMIEKWERQCRLEINPCYAQKPNSELE